MFPPNPYTKDNGGFINRHLGITHYLGEKHSNAGSVTDTDSRTANYRIDPTDPTAIIYDIVDIDGNIISTITVSNILPVPIPDTDTDLRNENYRPDPSNPANLLYDVVDIDGNVVSTETIVNLIYQHPKFTEGSVLFANQAGDPSENNDALFFNNSNPNLTIDSIGGDPLGVRTTQNGLNAYSDSGKWKSMLGTWGNGIYGVMSTNENDKGITIMRVARGNDLANSTKILVGDSCGEYRVYTKNTDGGKANSGNGIVSQFRFIKTGETTNGKSFGDYYFTIRNDNNGDSFVAELSSQKQNFIMRSTGQMNYGFYGLGSFAGAATYLLGANAQGEIVEIDASTLGGSTTANNGLSIDTLPATAGDVILGGELNRNTSIQGREFTFSRSYSQTVGANTNSTSFAENQFGFVFSGNYQNSQQNQFNANRDQIAMTHTGTFVNTDIQVRNNIAWTRAINTQTTGSLAGAEGWLTVNPSTVALTSNNPTADKTAYLNVIAGTAFGESQIILRTAKETTPTVSISEVKVDNYGLNIEKGNFVTPNKVVTPLTGLQTDFYQADLEHAQVLQFAGVVGVGGIDKMNGDPIREGTRLILFNNASASIRLFHEEAASTADYRLRMPNSLAWEFPPQSCIELIYISSRWTLINN